MAADYLVVQSISDTLPDRLGEVLKFLIPAKQTKIVPEGIFPETVDCRFLAGAEGRGAFIGLSPDLSAETLEKVIQNNRDSPLILYISSSHPLSGVRDFFKKLDQKGFKNPVILCKNYGQAGPEEIMIRAAGELGPLFIDGLGDGIWILDNHGSKNLSPLRETAFHILQASGARISKTEYIACPSCGRTLFNIQDTLRKIRKATSGMKGLKIAVMGCIVNGPGEMADADFGYVGAGRGRVSLYKGKQVVRKNIPEEGAVEALVDLIKSSH